MTERDQAIEHLLRRSGPAGQGPGAGDCPDAEVLAALADDLLAAGTRRELEAHLADCDRCQQFMAALARTEPAEVPSAGAVAPGGWWTRRRVLNWLAPAAAAATAVALWVAVPGQRTPLPAPQELQTTAPAAPPPPRSAEIDSRSAQQRADGAADATSRTEQADTQIGGMAETTPRPAPTPGSAPRPAPAAKGATSPAPALESPARPAPAEERFAPRLADQGEADQLARQEAAAERERSVSQDAVAPAAPARAAAGAAAFRAGASFDVLSPDARTLWRVGPDAAIQRSTDGGSSWVVQQAEVPAALVAGSSPAPAVCWLVGSSGTVLRTTNGGDDWQGLPFPEQADLISVLATSAASATVETVDGRRFSTTDGGQTWRSEGG
jgi:hypothetical protein